MKTRNTKNGVTLSMSERERFYLIRALETVHDILCSLELSPLNEYERRELAQICEIIK